MELKRSASKSFLYKRAVQPRGLKRWLLKLSEELLVKKIVLKITMEGWKQSSRKFWPGASHFHPTWPKSECTGCPFLVTSLFVRLVFNNNHGNSLFCQEQGRSFFLLSLSLSSMKKRWPNYFYNLKHGGRELERKSRTKNGEGFFLLERIFCWDFLMSLWRRIKFMRPPYVCR